MAYAYCIPAHIVDLRHARDNLVTGMVLIEGREIPFATRKHIVQATNKVYNRNHWKPAKGLDVLIDGDMGQTLVVDHIEADQRSETPYRSDLLDRIAEGLGGMSCATGHLKHWKPSDRDQGAWRLRWTAIVPANDEIISDRGGVLHAERDGATDEWRAWVTCAATGRRILQRIPAAAERMIRASLGDFDKPAPLPYDDCPF